MRTSITRPQQRRSQASHSRISTSETLCRNGHPRSPNPNARHVRSRTSRRTITPGPSVRRRNCPTRRQRAIFANSRRRATQLRLQGPIALATVVPPRLKPHSALPHPYRTHPHRRSATHYRIPPSRPHGPCHPGTTRMAHRTERSR
jgi:hypothetical protein